MGFFKSINLYFIFISINSIHFCPHLLSIYTYTITLRTLLRLYTYLECLPPCPIKLFEDVLPLIINTILDVISIYVNRQFKTYVSEKSKLYMLTRCSSCAADIVMMFNKAMFTTTLFTLYMSPLCNIIEEQTLIFIAMWMTAQGTCPSSHMVD